MLRSHYSEQHNVLVCTLTYNVEPNLGLDRQISKLSISVADSAKCGTRIEHRKFQRSDVNQVIFRPSVLPNKQDTTKDGIS